MRLHVGSLVLVCNAYVNYTLNSYYGPVAEEELIRGLPDMPSIGCARLLDWMENYFPPGLIRSRDVAMLNAGFGQHVTQYGAI
jgi:hypothetical protein